MNEGEEANKVRHHKSYEKAQNKAGKYKDNPEEIDKLVNEAFEKAGSRMPKNFEEIRENVLTLFSMVKSYAKRDYKEVSWQSIALVITSIIYFVSPVDMIPDFIPILGYIDDVALLGWTLKSIREDLEAFKMWKKSKELES